MERKIGEIFEFGGEWYQCVEGNDCANCVFIDYCKSYSKKERDSTIGLCVSFDRNDGMHVIFKKLEKVGEPYSCNYYGDNRLIMMQEYNLYNLDDVTNEDKIPMYITDYKHKRIAIEIKQTKGDMEEKKLNLKPFDIQKAREGKPVCTRDGHKARIICFDRKFYHDGYNYPIVAMVNDNDNELVHAYTQDGLLVGNMEGDLDLMMLPEKKEGWVNVMEGTAGKVYVGNDIYRTEDEAKEGASRFASKLIANVPIEWEE